MTRRGLFALIGAAVAGRKLPAPATPKLFDYELLNFHFGPVQFVRYPRKFKIGDTITVRRPARFRVQSE